MTRKTVTYDTASEEWMGAPSGGGSGGDTRKRFQVANNPAATQTTTGTFAVLAGMWAAPTHTHTNIAWNDGVATFNAALTVEINVQVLSWNNANNRHQLDLELQHDTGSGYATVVSAASYTSRNNTQDTGVTNIHGFVLDVSSGDKLRLRVKNVGVAATISGTTPFAVGVTSFWSMKTNT